MELHGIMRAAAAALGALLCFSGCAASSPPPVTKTGFALDTTVSVTLYGPADALDQGNDIVEECFAEIQKCERLFSATAESSDISRLNRAEGRRVEIDPRTSDLLKTGLAFGKLTGGALDITIRPVSRLWDFSGAAPRVPDAAALEQAVEAVDYTGLHVEEDSAWLDNPEAGVDLGGIAKGFIADRLAELLTGRGVDSALIDLGGNILALGEKNGGEWKIGIKDPRDPDKLAAILPLKNRSVVTSGVYERNFTADGVFYHHILDPKTGRPVCGGLASVTIVSEKSVDADALSTACFVLGTEKGLELIESLEGIEALFISDAGEMTASDGLVYTLP